MIKPAFSAEKRHVVSGITISTNKTAFNSQFYILFFKIKKLCLKGQMTVGEAIIETIFGPLYTCTTKLGLFGIQVHSRSLFSKRERYQKVYQHTYDIVIVNECSTVYTRERRNNRSFSRLDNLVAVCTSSTTVVCVLL